MRIVGQVVNMSADEAILGEDGLVDADKAQFLSFDRVRRVYRLLGGGGQAYHDGRKRWSEPGFAGEAGPSPGKAWKLCGTAQK
ncbi:MAG: hypothetical protein ACLS43_01250 [Evtepia gabavorous]